MKRIWWVAALILALVVLSSCALGDDGDKGGLTEEGVESLQGGYSWRREGGIAGFCDIVELSADGSASVSSCASDPPRLVADVRLSTAQARLIEQWVARFSPFEHEERDPATADAMTLSVDFDGNGEQQPGEGDIAAMSELAQQVLSQATR